MWLGLYLIAFSSWFFFCFFTKRIKTQSPELTEQYPRLFSLIAGLGLAGFFAVPIITIAYGINLIINN